MATYREEPNGQIVDKDTGDPIAGMSVLEVDDKIERLNGTVETVVYREVTPEGAVILRTVVS